MRAKLLATGTENKRLLVLGLFLGLLATLLVTSFYFVDNHRWYWDIAPFIAVLIVVSAASGGILTGHSLAATQERRLWLVGLGGVLGLAWIASGTVAASLGFLGMNCLPNGYIGWDSYSSQHLGGWLDISLLQFVTATGLLGGFCVGFGLSSKSKGGLQLSTAPFEKEL